MPSQMLAIVTDIRELWAFSHQTGSTPNRPRKRLRMPESGSIIHCQVVAETMIGSSHGTRKSPRSTPESGKLRRKNTASARPIPYWNTRETTSNTAVWRTVGQNCGIAKTSR